MNLKIEEKFQALIKKKKLRCTSQRKTILGAIFSSEEHFTAEELQAKLRHIQPKISPATIYRTISLLEEINLLQEISIGDKNKTYDPNFINHPSHNHLICTDCGKVIEFESKKTKEIHEEITKKKGFHLNRQSVSIEASCQTLREEGTCKELIKARLNQKRMPN